MVPTPHSPSAPRLLVVAPDVVGRKMAGPGLRYVAIAKALAPHMPVTLAVGVAGSDTLDLELPGVAIAPYSSRQELELLVAGHDAVFAQFFDTNVARAAVRRGVRLVFDLYNVLPVETVGSEIISGFSDAPSKDREFRELLKYFRFVSQAGSYFVASNERQRDYWMGYIMASGGLLPSTFGARELGDIVGLVPFGTEENDPVQREHGLRGKHGIGDDDIVLLWAGGIWDWFDAETPIRAVAKLAEEDQRYKLVFYGTVHPNSTIGRPPAVERAMTVAKDLGVLGSSVIFLDEWVAAADRADYLLDADVAISSHKDSLETHYAFRTRILDHFWASLPSIVSEGDWFADYIAKEGLGTVTPIGDVEATMEAIRSYGTDAELRAATVERVRAVREQWRWSRTTAPLRDVLLGDLMERPTPDIRPLQGGDEQPAHHEHHAPAGLRATRAWRLAARIKRRLIR